MNWFEEAKKKGLIHEGKSVNLDAVNAAVRSVDLDDNGPLIEALRDLPESAFQKLVVEMFEGNNWLVGHCRKVWVKDGDSGRCHYETPMSPGYPDLTMVHLRYATLVVAELKAETGTRTMAQMGWGDALAAAASRSGGAVIYRVWKPSDWPEIKTLALDGRLHE